MLKRLPRPDGRPAPPSSRLLKKTHMPTGCFKQAFMKVAVNRPGNFPRSKQSRSNLPLKYVSAHRPFRQAQGPSIFLGVLRSRVSLSNPDPSTMLRVMVRYSNHEALEGQAQGSTLRLTRTGGEEDRTTMLRVMVRYSNHEAQTRRELGRSLASEIFLTSLQSAFFNNLLVFRFRSSVNNSMGFIA